LGLEKIILEGNQKVSHDELLQSYEQLKIEMGEPGLSLFIDQD
jgi:hypothetical protein